MITFDEMAVLDANSEFLGVPTSQLMENAGRAVRDEVRDMLEQGRVLVVCGPGNNGGDGFVAARMLLEQDADAYDVDVVLARSAQETRTPLARENLNRLRQIHDRVHEMDEIGPEGLADLLEETDLVVDAMLGTGLHGDLREPYRTLVELIADAGRPTLAVDVPTGLGTDVILTPDRTVTFHDVKEGMSEETCGPITVADIGIPDEAQLFVGPGEMLTYYPLPTADSHKGQNGRVIVVGGGPYTGAPAIAGLAGMRIGADLVHLLVPERVFAPVASYWPDLIVHSYPGDHLDLDGDAVDQLDDLLADVDACVVGPGLGDAPDLHDHLATLFEKLSDHGTRVVVDADAIGFLGAHPEAAQGVDGVVTPHLGELRELVQGEVPDEVGECGEIVAETASRLGLAIVLKGPMDLISDGKEVKVNRTGNPRMTVGGTGDALAGMVGGLLAKGCKPYEAARIGAFVNGYAGDLAFDDMALSYTATEMLDAVPRIFREVFQERGVVLDPEG